MKGLILKDFYTAIKYMRSMLFIAIIFITVAFINEKNLFFFIFPVTFIGLLPMSLLSYDEKEKWNLYCELLPVTRHEVVSSKYLISFILEGILVMAITFLLFVRTLIIGSGTVSNVLPVITVCVAAGMLIPGFILPFIFKFGTERGRIFYYIVIGFIYGIFAFVQFSNISFKEILYSSPLTQFFIVSLFSIVIYGCSWLLSIRLYKSREL